MLSSISERGLTLRGPGAGARLDVTGLLRQCEALMSSHGEASGVVYARRVLSGFANLDAEQRLAFYRALAERYQPDLEAIQGATQAYSEAQTPQALQRLLAAVEPPRQELFRRLNLAPGGTVALVNMRVGLFEHLRSEPALRNVDADLVHLFESWFNRGFLVMRRIDWQTRAHILEKIINYEAVHEINGWEDLQRRVKPPDRRCFAFFHPAMGDEPLIFVEIALMHETPGRIDDVLNEDNAQLPVDEARTAVFYSISNCQAGLRGVSLGNFLIKQVVEELLQELPALKRFVTLSPVPGLLAWLHGLDAEREPEAAAALEILAEPAWYDDAQHLARATELLRPLAARYLLKAKREDGLPLDPVARFHLGNGASLDRIHAAADLSERGLDRSAGVMVNYLYDLDKFELNHEDYIDGKRIPASRQVRHLASDKRNDEARERGAARTARDRQRKSRNAD